MKFKEDQVNVFLDLFEKKRDAIAAFQGCRHLDLLRDKEDLCIFFTYSIWDGPADLDAYRHSTLFKELWAQTKILFAARAEAWSINTEWSSGL